MRTVLIVIVVVALLMGTNVLVYFVWRKSPGNEGKSGVPLIATMVGVEVVAGVIAVLTE